MDVTIKRPNTSSVTPRPWSEKSRCDGGGAVPGAAGHSVLLVGGTGRTGGQVLTQLLERGIAVCAIVRSADRLPAGGAHHPGLRVVEADLLSLTLGELQQHLEGCDTVISCLGHTISAKGIFGPPFSVVTRAMSNLAAAVQAMPRVQPTRFILMSSVSVHRPGKRERAHGSGQRLVLWLLRALVPPARDNQRAAGFFARQIGDNHPQMEWVAVRPDTLRIGDVTDYQLHDELVSSIFRPSETNMANVAHFMCELTEDDGAWIRWKGRLPVIVNARER